VARGSSQPHVEARGSSQPHVEAWESSQPHVEAWESSQPHVVARGSSQPHVEAWGSSQPHVEAWESSQPHVVARGSSQPHVEARGSSQPHVEAWESSQPHVEARGYVQISIFGAVIAKLGAHCSAIIHGKGAKVTGGSQTKVLLRKPKEWCDYYGVAVKGGTATLFKALNVDFTSPHGLLYAPGSTVEAPDWDGGKQECGGGLHFSPAPAMAREFHTGAIKYVACPVRLTDMAVHPYGEYPQKCKARRICKPIYEVDVDGERVEASV
jgi:hypothetical protein